MKQLTAQDIMTSNPMMVHHNQPITEVLALLKSKGVSGAPVLDDDDNLCGLVSLKDIAFDALFRKNAQDESQSGYMVSGGEPHVPVELPCSMEIPPTLKACDIMTPMVFTVPANASLNQIAEDMSKGRVHRLIVVDGENVVGIVSSLDLLKVIRTCD